MRRYAPLAIALTLSLHLAAQTCNTTISGTVYAPNGADPLPNIQVYVPTTTVGAYTPGVSCPVVGELLPGAPQVGATTAADGTFTITGAPVGTNIPLVITTGRWRRQITVPSTTACADTQVDKTISRMPRNQGEGDIPKFAIATGRADQVECVLRKVGIDDAEFTNPSGTGRINVYQGDGSVTAKQSSGGAIVDPTTPLESTLMGDASKLNAYDVLMLPCEGGNYTRSATQLTNLVNFANAGGRVYASHFAYSWMYQNPPFSTVANWAGSGAAVADSGVATVNTSFAEGITLSKWLDVVGASSPAGSGQIPVYVIKKDISGINAPTQSWLTLNATGNPVMQFVWDTPVGTGINQCGRVLFNEYHVENPPTAPTGVTFPAECSNAAMTPQEKLLEYSLFALTDGGGAGTLDPASADFGSEPVNFTTPTKPFKWTNNSTFQATVSSVTATGDYLVGSSNCNTVAAGASCTVNVAFKPAALGTRTGTLSVGAGAQTLTAALTGVGVPDLTISPTALDFGSIDVGATLTKTLTISNTASAGVAMPTLTAAGDYSSTSNCAATIPANTACTVLVTFKPTTSGTRAGTIGPSDAANPAYGNMVVTLTGIGLDFSVAVAPTSGSVIAGYTTSTVATVTPLSGFANTVSLTCSTNAPGSACALSNRVFVPSVATVSTMSITTTSTYTVIGFGGVGGRGILLFFAVASGLWMWSKRRSSTRILLRSVLTLVLLCGTALSVTGCSGKQPALNSNPTSPGNYTYTVTATDGTITHSATYSLTVTVK